MWLGIQYETLVFFCQQQSVNQAGPPLVDYKKNIESNFKSLKAGLVPKDKDSVPKLPQNQKEWWDPLSFIIEITWMNNFVTAALFCWLIAVEIIEGVLGQKTDKGGHLNWQIM